jgi:cytochrome c oxidase subunit 2
LAHKPANFHESVTVEVIWTVVPFIIVILMALPATKVLVAQKDTTNADLTIKATGYQWKWGYDYLKGEGEGIGLHLHAGQHAPRHVQQRRQGRGA